MNKYQVVIWIPGQYSSFTTFIYASNDIQAKLMLEGQYGPGSVMSYRRVTED